MSHYETVVDLTNRNSSHTLVVEMVGEGRTVLDVGCASGYLADALNERGCKVSGFERDAEDAERARPKLERLVVGDLERESLADAFAGHRFDRIVFGDVLEHLTRPEDVLRSALEILGPDGEVIISVPNVAHASLRLALLGGRWHYTDVGLLDRTHLRFMTLRYLVSLLADVGMVIEEAWSTVVDPQGTEVDFGGDWLPEGIVEWVRDQPHALDYQFVVRARRGEPTGALPVVKPAVPYDEARVEDRFTQRARKVEQIQHRGLVQRDFIVGLEAQLARTSREAEKARTELAEAKATIADLVHERWRLRSSRTWKLGRLVTAPLGVVKRIGK